MKSESRLSFPEWANALLASDLEEGKKKSFGITIRWYLGWCRRNKTQGTVMGDGNGVSPIIHDFKGVRTGSMFISHIAA
ncbi:MAG: hypothetical protein O3C43_11070 [Verrucomicrobia bacterium]|nr:hypothetical protein [Verrucomicrobiota bacterium]MDA1067035.1 hypothetical protein [Verrucomicrobiota bacterium]